MISTPALDAPVVPPPALTGWRVSAALYALSGFSALLAEEAFADDWRLAGIASTLICLLGLALGSLAANMLLRQGQVTRPFHAYGVAQLAAGACCIGFSYWSSPLLALLAAVFIGTAFPLAAGRLRHFCTSFLTGAAAASLAAPFVIMPAAGPRGALWICLAIGAAICAVTALTKSTPMPRSETAPIGRAVQLLLAASFGAGAVVFALAVIWTHLSTVVLGPSVYALSWIPAAILTGWLAVAVRTNRVAIRWSTLFQCTALILTAQLVLWDRVPAWFRFMPAVSEHSFFPAEIFRLAVAVFLLAPPSAALALIFPRLLDNHPLAGYLGSAAAFGSLTGVLLGTLVLSLAGSEVALKALVAIAVLLWVACLLREPVSRQRLATAALSGAIVLTVLLGRWWNWSSLTAGPAPFRTNVAPSKDVRYLPPTFVLKQEDARGGFTTVVEQTVVSGEAAQTVRTLFRNGVFQGDDNPTLGDAASLAGAPFVADTGSALLIGLGAGRGAAALRRAGFREIAVAESLPGIVRAAHDYFGVWNEGVLRDPHLKLYADDGRDVLSSGGPSYDLIAVNLTSIWFADSADVYSREFYQLAHSRLRPGGVLQESVQLDQLSPREIASELATVHSVFPYLGLWYEGGQGALVAAGRPLIAARSPGAEPLLDSAGVARLLAVFDPPITTDANRWIEYAAPRDQSNYAWATHNLEFLRHFR